MQSKTPVIVAVQSAQDALNSLIVEMIDQTRYVLSARIIGIIHTDAPKVKMFIMSVSWSDTNEVIIYRSFQEFKKFHKQLKKTFLHFNPSGRKMPKFKGGSFKRSMQQKGSRKSVRQMKFLDEYCSELLNFDAALTQSSEVTQFFTPRAHDLQPDFTKNSILILHSDELPGGSRGDLGGEPKRRAGSVTQPFVTQSYSCLAAYETKDTKNCPFKVVPEEKLDVLIKDPAGWWLVENELKHLAWFPAPYLQICDEEDQTDDPGGYTMEGPLYCAVRNYASKAEDEVALTIGCVVQVLQRSNDGWWLVRYNMRVGYVPSMYLQPYANPHAGLCSLQRKLYSSTVNLAAPPRPADRKTGCLAPASLPGEESSASESRKGSLSSTTTNFSISSFTSGSSGSGEDLRGNRGSGRSASMCSEGSSGGSSSDVSSSSTQARGVVPRVPPRPQTQDILTRCTTMTRKAALASRTRLLSQSETPQSR